LFVYTQKRIQKREVQPRFYSDYKMESYGVFPVDYDDWIKRPKMSVFDIKLIDNLPGGKKKQTHIVSINYWTFIDGRAKDMILTDGRLDDILNNSYGTVTEEMGSQILELIKEELRTIEKECKSNYKQDFPEEYAAAQRKRKIDDLYSKTKKAREESERSQQEEYQRKSDEEYAKTYQKYQQHFGGSSTSLQSKYSVEDKEIIRTIISTGRKALAKKNHPDHGGDDETMKKINVVTDKLLDSFGLDSPK